MLYLKRFITAVMPDSEGKPDIKGWCTFKHLFSDVLHKGNENAEGDKTMAVKKNAEKKVALGGVNP